MDRRWARSPAWRHVCAFPGHDDLHKYPGQARYRAMDALMVGTLAT